jgi:hypothetical protein
MGHASVIWQGDASEIAIRSLSICDSPPKVLNVAGPETVSVRWLAEQFGELLVVVPVFAHEELDTSYVINASESHKLLGYPKVTLGQMIEWVAQWIEAVGTSLSKPTHFQEREGEF